MAGLLNGICRRETSRAGREMVRKWRRRACLRVRAGAEAKAVRREFDPHHALGPAIEANDVCGLRDIDRRARLQDAANRTASVVGAMPGLVVLPGRGPCIAMTDNGRGERVGGRDAGRPACTDRRKNLHQERDQDDR